MAARRTSKRNLLAPSDRGDGKESKLGQLAKHFARKDEREKPQLHDGGLPEGQNMLYAEWKYAAGLFMQARVGF